MQKLFSAHQTPALLLPELQVFASLKPESLAVSLRDHVLAQDIEEVPLAVRIWARKGFNSNRRAIRSPRPEIFQQ